MQVVHFPAYARRKMIYRYVFQFHILVFASPEHFFKAPPPPSSRLPFLFWDRYYFFPFSKNGACLLLTKTFISIFLSFGFFLCVLTRWFLFSFAFFLLICSVVCLFLSLLFFLSILSFFHSFFFSLFLCFFVSLFLCFFLSF